MDRQPNDGLIGMAFGTIAQSRRSTFFESLIAQRKLAAPLFSVHLSRHEESGSSVCILILSFTTHSKFTAGVLRLRRLESHDWSRDMASRGI